MQKRGKIPLGLCLFFSLLFFGIFLIGTFLDTNFLRTGVPAQGVVTNSISMKCGKSGLKPDFSVQFNDRAGQQHSGIISKCVYPDFDAAVGDTVAIVYLPDDPTQIAPPDGLLKNVKLAIILTILSGILTLTLLYLWIGKRIRKSRELKQLAQSKYPDASFPE